jgi:alpha,alpha-trehalase
MAAPAGLAGVLLALSLLALLGGYPLHWPLVWTAAVGWVRATPVSAAVVVERAPGAPSRGALPCRHPVYCYGRLLRTVQLSGLFNDSKTLVDRPLRAPPAVVLRAFAALPPSPDLETLAAFVATYFDPEGSELQTWLPPDWRADPTMLEGITDLELRAFVADLHGRWRQLGRAFNRTSDCPDCYSSFALPGAFIVPGGRFREAYYWDSYWVVDALLLGGMATTARTVLDNFLFMVRTYGFVPNGGRIYYTARSQPPLLARMIRAYADATGDMEYAIAAYPLLRDEHAFWMRDRTVVLPLPDGTNTTLNVYAVPSSVPRPEAYKEDDALAAGLEDRARRALFRSAFFFLFLLSHCIAAPDRRLRLHPSELASGAESGWDYSSRWLRVPTDLGTLQTRSLVPVDLNSILYDAECWLATLADASGDANAAGAYRALAAQRRHGMHMLMWDTDAALYRDYHWPTAQQTQGEPRGPCPFASCTPPV